VGVACRGVDTGRPPPGRNSAGAAPSPPPVSPVPPYARAAFTGVVTSPTSRRGGVSLDTATDTAKKPFKAHLPRKGARKALDAFWHLARLLVDLPGDRALAAILARCVAPGVLVGAAARQRCRFRHSRSQQTQRSPPSKPLRFVWTGTSGSLA
jgi:hypothetical protein